MADKHVWLRSKLPAMELNGKSVQFRIRINPENTSTQRSPTSVLELSRALVTFGHEKTTSGKPESRSSLLCRGNTDTNLLIISFTALNRAPT